MEEKEKKTGRRHILFFVVSQVRGHKGRRSKICDIKTLLPFQRSAPVHNCTCCRSCCHSEHQTRCRFHNQTTLERPDDFSPTQNMLESYYGADFLWVPLRKKGREKPATSFSTLQKLSTSSLQALVLFCFFPSTSTSRLLPPLNAVFPSDRRWPAANKPIKLEWLPAKWVQDQPERKCSASLSVVFFFHYTRCFLQATDDCGAIFHTLLIASVCRVRKH